MYPKNPKETQVVVGSMNVRYDIYPTLLGTEPTTNSVSSAHILTIFFNNFWNKWFFNIFINKFYGQLTCKQWKNINANTDQNMFHWIILKIELKSEN